MPTRKSVKRNNKTMKGGFNMQYAHDDYDNSAPLKRGQFIRRLDENKAYHWHSEVARAVNLVPIADIEYALRQLEAKVDALSAKMNVSGQ